MNLSFIGTGYVGLVSATCFAEMGNQVYCVDVDANKVVRLQGGQLTIYEPGLEQLFERNVRDGRIQFTTHLQMAAHHAEVIFLTLPTPPQEDGSADLSYVLSVCDQLVPVLKQQYKILVTKSTVPVGTADRITKQLEAAGLQAGKHFDVVSNPEFLREGSAVMDFLKPERVVIGTSSVRAEEIMKTLYEPFVRNGNPILAMDARSSELVKYAANGFLAMKISFMNEIANLCERSGANIEKIRKGIGADSRIGHQFLYAGLGYGGSCFPKDVQALSFTSNEFNYSFEILDAVMNVNKRQRMQMIERMEQQMGSLQGKKIGCWGLAFKPNTDDIREAPALWLIEELMKRGATIIAYDPAAMDNTKKVLPTIEYATDPYEATNNCHALLICTEWNEFRNPDFDRLKYELLNPIIFDGRNLFDPVKMASIGFIYHSIGRATLPAEISFEAQLKLAV
ncbi:MAG: UDP-glucose/GDP-mannose dehydrogenase family protein [Bacteroidetes bacterium]|nr:UDP-glucose/GDP-mannose dehydrogenase family protein [Bacteroidota bacterium]